MSSKKTIVISLLVLIFYSCISHKPETISVEKSSNGKSIGIVSLKYKTTGCGVVILINEEGNEQVLVPKLGFKDEFEKEGLAIKFTYRRLRVPLPEGCQTGAMVEVLSIEKK